MASMIEMLEAGEMPPQEAATDRRGSERLLAWIRKILDAEARPCGRPWTGSVTAT